MIVRNIPSYIIHNYSGITGLSGPTGPAGIDGATGIAGINGITGIAGTDSQLSGITGVSGAIFTSDFTAWFTQGLLTGATGAWSPGADQYDFTPPTISSINPEDSATGVALVPTIQINFDKQMKQDTITVNTANNSLTGYSIIVSQDDFSNAIPMEAAPVMSNGGKTFSFKPKYLLGLSSTIKVKITTSVRDASFNYLATEYISNGFTTQE